MNQRLLNHLRNHGSKFSLSHDGKAKLFTMRLELKLSLPPKVYSSQRSFTDAEFWMWDTMTDELCSRQEAAIASNENLASGRGHLAKLLDSQGVDRADG